MDPDEPDELLQRLERLVLFSQKTKVQPETVKSRRPMGPKHFGVDPNDRIPADEPRVAPQQLDRSFPAQQVNRCVSLQVPKQMEILMQDLATSRVPPGIDNEYPKTRDRRGEPRAVIRCRIRGRR